MHVYFLYIILVSIDPQNIESKTLSLSPQNQTAKPKALTLDPKPETKLMSGHEFSFGFRVYENLSAEKKKSPTDRAATIHSKPKPYT